MEREGPEEHGRRLMDRMARGAREAESTARADYREASRARLAGIVATKIRTTMIGGLSAFEEAFGHLWGRGKPRGLLTPTERIQLETWLELRTRILNQGNGQIRAAGAEIAQYDVTWNRYHLDLEAHRGGTEPAPGPERGVSDR